MTSNVILDVAIGLVFIYLLYSLLASTVSELVATLFAYRSRMLERGLEQMLDGKNYSVYWWDKLLMNVLIAAKSMLNGQKGADKLKIESSTTKPGPNQRAIDYCASFEKTIISKTDVCKKTKLFATAITAHPLYRRSAENSVFFKKPAYLPATVFTDILIDVLGPGQTDKPVLLKEIAANIENNTTRSTVVLNKELIEILNIYLKQANGDMQRFRLLVENWYDETMNRVSGWYKKQTFRVLLIIGFILACLFNVDTIAIVQKLSADKNLREAMVKSATEYIKTHPNGSANKSPASTKPVAGDTNTTKPAKTPPAKPVDTAEKKTAATVKAPVQKKAADSNSIDTAALRKKIDSVKAVYALIEPVNASLGLGWGDFGFKKDSLARAKGVDSLKKLLVKDTKYLSQVSLFTGKLNAILKKNGIKNIGVLKKMIEITSKASLKVKEARKELVCLNKKEPHKGFLGKLWHILTHIGFLGVLLTALAISLGAPFWFDLLNKFINLRVSGAKPEPETSAAKKTVAANKPSPQAFG